MNKQLKDNYIKQAITSRIVYGGQVERRGGRLIWRLDTNEDDNDNIFFTKVKDTVVVNDVEIHFNKEIVFRKKAVFVNKGVERVENEAIICKIEFIERNKISPASRFISLKGSAKQNQIKKAIVELYNQESEEIQAFAATVDKIIEKQEKKQTFDATRI